MARTPCCDGTGVKKGPWTPEEDKLLIDYIKRNGYGSWRLLPKRAGLNRCGKSCRLRWTNYLRPDIKRGQFDEEEEKLIIHLHSILGNKWSSIAAKLPGRTDNEVKNYWNTHLRKKLLCMGIDPMTHQPRTDILTPSNLETLVFMSQPNALDLLRLHLVQILFQTVTTTNPAFINTNKDLILGLMGSSENRLSNQTNPSMSCISNMEFNDSNNRYQQEVSATDKETNGSSIPPFVSVSSKIEKYRNTSADYSLPYLDQFEALEYLNLDEFSSDSCWKSIIEQMAVSK
ncbi:hypothetical protein LUZ60_009484 [Juncus effusus]|nr:hypothetical protein LUZ60_009484 [Juncus effusus]